jgi:hypothetical protein
MKRGKNVKKRKADKMQQLEEDIRDDERLFDDSEITERERLQRQYKKKILNIVKDYNVIEQEEKEQRYVDFSFDFYYLTWWGIMAYQGQEFPVFFQ